MDKEEYAAKLDEIGNKLPNLVGDHLALIAYAADLKALAERVRNPDAVRPNPAGQPDVRPAYRALHPDGQEEAVRPKVRLADDPNAPMHLPIAQPDPASADAYTAPAPDRQENVTMTADNSPSKNKTPEPKVPDNKPETVANRTKYGSGSDTQKGAGKPGKL